MESLNLEVTSDHVISRGMGYSTSESFAAIPPSSSFSLVLHSSVLDRSENSTMEQRQTEHIRKTGGCCSVCTPCTLFRIKHQ